MEERKATHPLRIACQLDDLPVVGTKVMAIFMQFSCDNRAEMRRISSDPGLHRGNRADR
jgi:hypothetical protein